MQHHDDEEDNESTSSSNDPQEEHIDDDEDFSPIPIQASDDSDDKTEPTSNLHHHHHLSFDLEEEESELQRYRLSRQVSSSSLSQGNATLSKKITLTTMWQWYLDTRMEHRRKRAEQLLSMNEDSLVERMQVTFSSWTDLFDTRGLLLHLLLFIVWLIVCHVYPKKRGTIVLVGILFFAARLAWRPCYWYTFGRRKEQKRQETMAIYDELNGSSWNASDEHDNVIQNIV